MEDCLDNICDAAKPEIFSVRPKRGEQKVGEAIFGPIVGLAVSAMTGWQLIDGFRSGTMEAPYWGFAFSGRKKDQPFRFWMLALLLALWMVGGILLCIGMLFFPNGIAE